MKKIYIILLVFLVMTSCQDDILDKQPLDLITDAAVWNDPVLIDAFLATQYNLTTVMVNECEAYINNWSDGSPVDGKWDLFKTEQFSGFLFINQMADESKEGWAVAGTATFKAGGLKINGGILEWWEYPYYVIRNLNQIIERLPNSPISDDLKVKKIAEARFLRAFNYFNMVKRYGGVPLITKEQQLNDPEEVLYPVRNSEQEIYDFVISEMDAIANNLSETPTYGRPCKWAALTLKSRAALYAGSIAQFGDIKLGGLLGIPQNLSSGYYQAAYNAAKGIINSGTYQLYNVDVDKVKNFRNIFLVKRNSEVIFAKQHNFISALDAGGNTWSYDFVQMPKPHGWNLGMSNAAYLEMAESFEYKDGTTGKLNREKIQQGLWSIEDLWGNKDPRFFATLYTMETPWRGGKVDFHKGLITPDGTILENEPEGYKGVPAWGNQNILGDFGTGFGVMKYLDEKVDIGGMFSNSGTDYIVFRYGEVLLNFAEAAFELGKTGESLDAINQIRKRAGIVTLTSVDRDIIRHERKVELAFEGHHYWDLRRWRIATTSLTRSFSGLRYILDYNTRKYKLEVLNNIDGANNPPRFYDYNYYFPITLKRTGANSNLIENPGY